MKKILLLFWLVFYYALSGTNAYAQSYNLQSGVNSIITCGGTFYDDGGPSNDYSSSFSGTVTFYPEVVGSNVQLTFTSFTLEGCCDYVTIFNGNNVNATQLFSGNGTTLPNGGATYTSTAADGSLTVRFTSDGSVIRAGWAATLGCTASTAPACSNPTETITATISATNGGFGSLFRVGASGMQATGYSYQWQMGETATGPWVDVAGATSASTNITAINTAGIRYYRMRVLCTASQLETFSNVVQYETRAIFLMGNGSQSFTACEGNFYDNGGATGNYTGNSNGTMTFYPASPNSSVQLVFTSFNVESCCDLFYIYNGNSTGATQIYSSSGYTGLPNGGLPIMSSAADGSLTVRFSSDGSVQYDGWAATISCVANCAGPINDVVIALTRSEGISGQAFVGSAPQVTSGRVTYQWETSNSLTGPWTNVANGTSFTANIVAPATAGVYYYRLKLTCGVTGDITYSNVQSFTVLPNFPIAAGNSTITTCSGIFVDAGLTGNYANNFDGVVTIVPNDPTMAVTLTFTEFNTQVNSDFLSIFDGSSVASPVLVNQHSGANILPNAGQPIVSQGPDGTLTVRFVSNASTVAAGWLANIGCTQNMNPICDATIVAGQTQFSASQGYPSRAFNASVSNGTQARGITYQWQQSASENGPWTNVAGATNRGSSITAAAAPGVTYYRLESNCTISNTIVYSNPEPYTVLPVVIMPTTGTSTVTGCDFAFFDSGTDVGNYSAYENGTVVFNPSSPGASVQITFTFFDMESATWDYIRVFNGNTATGTPLINNFGGSGTLPNLGNPIISTANNGSLTVTFNSDGSGTYRGWEATIGCVYACDGPIEDVDIQLSARAGFSNSTITGRIPQVNYTGVQYQWERATSVNGPWVTVAGATNFSSPLAVGTDTMSYYRLMLTCTATGDVTYSANIDSFRIVPSVVMPVGPALVTACNGVFTDPGGQAVYSNNFSGRVTIAPTDPSLAVQLTFTQFRTEQSPDLITIFNGSNITDPVILPAFGGSLLPNGGLPIVSTATDGTLTVTFVTDGSVTYDGWEAVIGCVANANPLCDASLVGGQAVLLPSIGQGGAVFVGTVQNQTLAANVSYQWQSSLSPNGPWEDIVGATISNSPITAPLEDTISYYRLRMTCNGTGTTVYSTPSVFRLVDAFSMPRTGQQTRTTCAMVFYDSGGADADYTNSESGIVTFYPEGQTQVILTFSDFRTEGIDDLRVFNGNSIAAPQLFEFNGQALPNGGQPITSSAADGSLTVQFYSDGSVVYRGWRAAVTCACTNETVEVEEVVCVSTLPFMFGEEPLTETGYFTRTIEASTGCDSTINLSLVVLNEGESFVTVRACESPYVWAVNGQSYTTSGMYTAAIPAVNGCDSVINMNLILNPTNRNITRSGSTLTVSQQNATYQWVDCANDFAVIANATSRTFTPTVRGVYACEITLNNCMTRSECVDMNDLSISHLDGNTISVHPNPTTEIFVVTSSNSFNNDLIEVYNSVGQLVYNGKHSGTEVKISLADFPVGVYVIKINNNQNLRVVKF